MQIMDEARKSTFRESRLRSLLKAIFYRIVSIAGTGTLTWIITKDIQETLSITLTIQVFLVVLYYSYERIWDRINWGRTKGTN